MAELLPNKVYKLIWKIEDFKNIEIPDGGADNDIFINACFRLESDYEIYVQINLYNSTICAQHNMLNKCAVHTFSLLNGSYANKHVFHNEYDLRFYSTTAKGVVIHDECFLKNNCTLSDLILQLELSLDTLAFSSSPTTTTTVLFVESKLNKPMMETFTLSPAVIKVSVPFITTNNKLVFSISEQRGRGGGYFVRIKCVDIDVGDVVTLAYNSLIFCLSGYVRGAAERTITVNDFKLNIVTILRYYRASAAREICIETMPPPPPPLSNHELVPFEFDAKQMASIYASKKYADLRINIAHGSTLIMAHKLILASRCALWKQPAAAAASGDSNLATIYEWDEDRFDANTMNQLLEFVYTNRIPGVVTAQLMLAAIAYGVDELKVACESALIGATNVANAVLMLKLSENCDGDGSLDRLREHVRRFIRNGILTRSDGKVLFNELNEYSSDSLYAILTMKVE